MDYFSIGITINGIDKELSNVSKTQLKFYIKNNKNDIYYIFHDGKFLYTDEVECSAQSYISNYTMLPHMYSPLTEFDIYIILIFNP